ncbi:UTP--glucose-1-phosphate uridylyltransferase-like isoform X2 [Porites lutea]|uniref:UTP--glucose-1-phosphate uridylyltransferase-like isoform X1 n=2 Tax=Porites lutea TaxID=51062 RepID=UPI003CC63A62
MMFLTENKLHKNMSDEGKEATLRTNHFWTSCEADPVIEFKTLSRKDAFERMDNELKLLLATAPEERQAEAKLHVKSFKELFARFLEDTGPSVEWEKIKPPPEGSILKYNEIPVATESDIKTVLNKLVVIKLNGGLGTSMGCTGPKSLISLRRDLTFLDMNVQQIEHLNNTYGCSVPLVLMNSFNTHDETQKTLRKYSACNVKIHCFNQSCHPRIVKESLLPLPSVMGKEHGFNVEHWNPPGHGDIYRSFYNSGLLKKFLDEGKEYMFVSNIDNLGATVDVNILNYMNNPSKSPSPEFIMEVTDKTRADVKGGTLIEYEGKQRLLEIAQVPKEHVDEFKSVNKFRIFNTNNLWMKLSAVKRIVEERKMDMEIIVNNKTLDNGMRIIQLETAVGAAMKNFEGAHGINVPRRRFLPVKTCSDLLIIMSNLYEMKHGQLEMSHLRQFPTVPIVQLSGSHFKKVKDFLARFETIPDLLELDHLTVSGDVTFGKGVSLKGTVIVIANHGDRIDIPSGALLENKIVSGNLRILQH